MKTHRITLTEQDISVLELILSHLIDYMIGDDRPDHGLHKLESLRDIPEAERKKIILLWQKFLKMEKVRK